MNRSYKLWALSGLLLAAMAGCGGGGDGGSASGGGSTPVVTISGVAATGAAFTGGTVNVIDSRGVTVGSGAAVQADGSYSITLASGAVAPFVLIASRTDANGDTQQLVSVIASATDTVANITPITSLIASRLSPSGDPAKLADELAAGTADITAQAVADVVTEVNTILAPLLSATGTTGADPLTDTFSTDGTGYDRLLDSINITFLPDSSTTTNIEIVVKQEVPEGDQPVALSFTNTTTSVTPLPTITAGTLIPDGTSAKIATFLSELTACYALPAAQRATAPSTVNATACRNVFHNDDPATFKNNGAVVSSTAAFSSLFSSNADGAEFSQGTYEFTRANAEKDIVVGYKVKGSDGGESYDTFVLRTGLDGKLRLIGNQYRFPGRVAAYQQKRNFISLNQQTYDYYSTGYVLDVPNRQRPSNGGDLFDRVIVTTPTGAVLTLKPSGASSFLGLVKPDTTITGTSFVRLRSEYLQSGPVVHPRDVDDTLFFVPTDRTEADLAAAKSLGTWKFEYFLTVNDPATPQDDMVVPEVQYFKNRVRALTIAELRTQGLAPLVPTLVTDIRSGTNAANVPRPGQLVFTADERGDISVNGSGDGWSVATGQLPPTSITFFGRSPTGLNFTDSVDVRSTARQATVPCSVQGMSDDHCFNGGPGFAAGSSLTGLHLFARDALGREYANFYAMYQLSIAP